MGLSELETLLAELAHLQDDFAQRREELDRTSLAMLHRPVLGGQVIARVCATEETAPELGALTELLGSTLDAARIAAENREKCGTAFLQAVADEVALASGQDRLSTFHRLFLASAWTRNGLPAPETLELSATDFEVSGLAPGMPDRAEADVLLDDLFRNLIEQTEGDALALHAALTETLPAMPVEMRAQVIRLSAERPEPIHARLACFWLLDRDATIRVAAACALAERPASGALSTELADKMVVLRNWKSKDEARAKLDEAVQLSMRSGLSAGAAPGPAL